MIRSVLQDRDLKGNIVSYYDFINDLNILPELRKLKQNNVRILISIAGISSEGSGIIANLTKDDKISLFVKNIMDTVEYCNFAPAGWSAESK